MPNPHTTMPFTLDPFTVRPYVVNPYDDPVPFVFTNSAPWASTPYVSVYYSSDILWEWSDGTTDNKAIPDAVSVVGTHTLKIIPWDYIGWVDFDNRNLIGQFDTMAWPMLHYLYCNSNAHTGKFITYAWPSVMYICCNNNNFTGDFRTFAWPNIRYLYPFNNINFTGIFQLYDWPRLIWLACFNNNFTHLSGSLKTQIKMITCNFSGNAITESAEIDLALSDLEVNAADVGRTVVCNVNFSGGTNSGPTAAGTASKDNLVNNHGWTVTLNPEV